MKNIKFIVLSCFIIFCFLSTLKMQASAQTQRWIFIIQSLDGIDFYFDKDFEKLKSGNVRIWEKQVFKDGSFAVGLKENNCSKKIVRFTQTALYNRFGNLINVNNVTDKWLPIAPDTVGETLLDFICKESPTNTKTQDIQRRIKQNSNQTFFAQINVRKANFRRLPSMKSKVIGQFIFGEQLPIVMKKGGWYQVINTDTGSKGWLHGNTFKLVKVENKSNKN